jgi:flagellar basal-body rod modification protein FlgD
LENQDPLNPMDNTTFVSELAQFSSLEQLTTLNTSMTSLLEATQGEELIGATNFIGKTVTATGNTLVKSGDSVSSAAYTLSSDMADVKVYVLDSNYSVVKTDDLGAQSSGKQTYQWDGTDSDGSTTSDGTYYITVYATSSTGTTSSVTTSVSGTVTGTSADSSGAVQLTLSDGRTVSFTNVTSVTDSTDTSS